VSRIDDAPGVKDRHPGHRLLDGRRDRQEDTLGIGHVRDGGGLKRERVRAPSDDREEVHEPRGRQAAGDLRHIARGEAARRHLVARDPGAHHPIAPDLPPDLPEHLEAEAQAVVEASAVFVRTLVEERRPELVHEVVVGKGQLHAVQAALAAAARRIAERPHQHGDLFGLDLVRHLAVDFLGNLRGRQQHVPALHVGLGPPPHVRELAHDAAVVPVHGLRDAAVPRDDGVVVVGDHVPGARGRGGVNAGRAADDREAGAAPGLGFVVGAEAGAGLAVLRHRFRVAAREDAVLQRQTAHAERREQVAKLVGHGPLLDGRSTRNAPGPTR
jgi:hypothetical protein